MDHKTRIIVLESDSFIKDTTHFLKEIKDLQLQPGDILVVIDVKSLYTSIKHNKGIIALKEALQKRGMDISEVWLIAALARIILTSNEFEFNGKCYRQKQGTAMDTCMAPQYANIFMTWLETKMLGDWNNPQEIVMWKRFIDDIFMIRRGTRERLDEGG